MKLAKAKEILLNYRLSIPPIHARDLDAAILLSCEASSFILLARVNTPGSVPSLLHGED